MLFVAILSLCFSVASAQDTHLWEQVATRLTHKTLSSANISDKKNMLQLSAANALIKYGQKMPLLSSETLQTLESLHLFDSVIPMLAHTNLHHGYFTFAKNMCSISHHIQQLQQQQEIIVYLQQHPDLVEELSTLLQQAQEPEEIFLADFYPKGSDFLANRDTKQEQNGLWEKACKLYEQAYQAFFKNRFAAEWYQRSGQWATLMLWSHLVWKIKTLDRSIAAEQTYRETSINNDIGFFKQLNIFHFQSIDDFIDRRKTNYISYSRKMSKVNAYCMVAFLAFSYSQMTYGTKKDFDSIYRAQQNFISLNTMFTTSQKIYNLLTEHPQLAQLLPEMETLHYFVKLKESNDTPDRELQRFINLLNSSTFTGQPHYLVSFQGKIIETQFVFEGVKHHFVKLWQALGEIDSHLCVQELLSGKHGQFCMPTWTTSPEPVLHLTNYWHPTIPHNKAVLNSMQLGTLANVFNPHNVVITGANAGGKTTAMTAIMIAQLMAQSIGIAPAQALTATPFTRFHTYLDITTNLKESESLFVAQANRAEKLYNSITSCHHDEKSLTILDEIFTGTRADFASKASFDFAQRLGNMKHSVCLLATHFPQLTELENMNLFINYQAANATINADGSISYPYKIIPGISTQNIAEHILRHKGLLS